jgi:hypothetical protein
LSFSFSDCDSDGLGVAEGRFGKFGLLEGGFIPEFDEDEAATHAHRMMIPRGVRTGVH